MRDVAIVSFAQSNTEVEDRNEIELLLPVAQEAIKASGLERSEIEFTCSGSSDWLQGQPFAFVMALLHVRLPATTKRSERPLLVFTSKPFGKTPAVRQGMTSEIS